MTALGVFRDDFYNAISVLPNSQYNTTSQAAGTLSAPLIGGAGDCYVVTSGATVLTIDSAVNIIAQIQNAVATAYKQGLGAFAAGVNPPPGVPNLFNVSWTLTIQNTNAGTLTLSSSAGSGVTITGTATILTANARIFIVTITSPTTVSIQSVYAGAVIP